MALSFRPRMPEAVSRLLDSPRVAAYLRPADPPFALEVTSRGLHAVAIDRGKDGVRLLAERSVALAPGLVEPALLRPAVSDAQAFAARVREALDGLPGFDGKLSVLLPDKVAKVSLVDLEEQASTLSERTELIRWKLKRTTPFRIEDGRIACQSLGRLARGERFLVSLVLKTVLEQIEQVLQGLGLDAGHIDLTTLSVWNLEYARLSAPGDSLLLNVGEEYATAVVGREGTPLFVRSRAVSPADAADGLKTELHPTLLYYQDRIGGPGIRRCLLRAPEDLFAGLARILEDRLHVGAEPVTVTGVAGAEGLSPARLSVLAPALGAALGR